MRKSFLVILSFVFSLQLINAQEEKLDMDMIGKIRKEGLENSKVMEIAMYLTDVSGPRLTASPGYMRAATCNNQISCNHLLMKQTLLPALKPYPFG